jgi:4-amino-4-deoxy-L-arabinose transferase-like glycosyltransferase
VPLGLAFYFGLHLISRVLVSPSLELDEAEQLFHLQMLALGYGFQPPLYTWMQALVFTVTGPSVFGLALLKAVLLWLTWWAVYRTARLFYEGKDALAIGLSLALFPQYLWESQRDLTHTVLLVACVALFWLVLLGVRALPRAGLAVLALGALAGASILAKYSAGLWLVIVVAAIALAGGPLRQWLQVRTLAVVAVVAALVVLPHAFWLSQNMHEVATPIQSKLGMASDQLLDYGAAVLSLVQALAGFVGLWLLVTLIAWGSSAKAPNAAIPHAHVPSRFWAAYLLVFLAALLGMIVFADASHFKDRWMQPFLLILPLAFAKLVCMNGLPRALRLAWTASALVLMLLALTLMPLRTVLGTQTSELSRLAIPYEKLAQALKQDYPEARTLVAPQGLVAGNLALYAKANNWQVRVEGSEGLAQNPLHSKVLWVSQEQPSCGPVAAPPLDWVERGSYAFNLRYDQNVKGLTQAVWRVYGPPAPP